MNICHSQNTNASKLPSLVRQLKTLSLIAFTAMAILIAGCKDSSGSSSNSGATQTNAPDTDAGSSDSLQLSANDGIDTASQDRANVLPDVLGDIAETAPIVFEPSIMNLGKMFPLELVSSKFSIRNVGNKAITIKAVRPSCGCTKLDDYSGLVIGPGEALELEARIKSRTVPSQFTSAISFLFEEHIGQSTINMFGEITRPIRTAPQTFNLVERPITGKRIQSGLVVVEAIDGRPFNILSANGVDPIYLDYDPDLDEVKSSYTLEWDVSHYNDTTRPGWWVIETDHPNCAIVEVRLRHESTMPDPPGARRWRVRTLHIVVGGIKPGESAVFEVDVVNPLREKIDVRSLSRNFNAKLVSFDLVGEIPPDSTIRVRITPTPGYEGLFYDKIMFLSDSNQTQNITIIGKALENTEEGE